jgi:hypothetical protein
VINLALLPAIIAASIAKEAGAPPPVTARYWRIRVYDNYSGGSTAAISAAEIEMRASAGGPDQCVGGTPAVSSTSEGSAANIFDNDGATRWVSVNANYGTHWISYDFGSPVSVVEISYSKRPDTFGRNEAITYADVQYSDNNSTWSTDWTIFTLSTWGTGAETRVFNKDDVLPTGIGYQLSISRTGYSEFETVTSSGLAEVEMRLTPGGADQCSGGVALANSGTPGNAFDNNTSTLWTPSATALPHTLLYQFAASRNIREIAITSRGDNFLGDGPTEFKLQSKDGPTVDLFTFRTGPWGRGETRVFNRDTYVEQPGRFIRIRPTGVHGGASARFSCAKLEFRTSIGGPDICTGGTAFARDYSDANFPENAFDGTLGSRYSQRLVGNFGATPRNYLGYHLTSEIGQNVVQVALTCTNETFGPSEAPTGFRVEYGIGNVWTLLWQESSIPAWTAGETRVFTKP